MNQKNIDLLELDLNKVTKNIEQQLKNITKGRWVVGSNNCVLVSNGKKLDFDIVCSEIEHENNAQFIANAPENIGFLLSQLERKQKKMEQLKELLNAKVVFINNGWEEERYVLQDKVIRYEKALEEMVADEENWYGNPWWIDKAKEALDS